MRFIASASAAALILFAALSLCPAEEKKDAAAPQPDKDGFYALFDGKSLDGWKAAEHPETFKVEEGNIVVNGARAHLFYDGPVNKHDFKNFHLRAVLQTFPGANSGIYFHTEFQDANWPSKGFECQVNATHSDIKKSGGLYGVKDVLNTAPHKDNEWFTYDIIVQGKKVTLKINDVVTSEWEQPEGWTGPGTKPSGRVLSHGTIAIQGHDPKSKVVYKSVLIKPLAD